MPKISQKIIEVSFYLLFFLVPLILIPWNYELFEFNKIILAYGLTVVISASWLIKMILKKRLIFQRTPLDIAILLFLVSQIISTALSIDPHISVFGYYSRFNGGLISTVSYILLYYAFVSNFPKEKLASLLRYIFSSAFLVALYGILERLGIDKNIWVQDVQNRVFSTLGQPNWLGAYLAVLIPISLSLILNSKFLLLNSILNILFFATLIFTKSRSGFLGLGLGLFVFWIFNFLNYKSKILKLFLILNSFFLILIFLFGTPFAQLNKFTLPGLTAKQKGAPAAQNAPVGSSIIDVGITESSVIRNIVWKGSINIFKNYPIFGSGVETFAFSYFKFRPIEHNMTSEWDFLYNKAHNEYLNYAATTGAFGLGSYLLIIFIFIFWFQKNIQKLAANNYQLMTGLLAGWLTILITNFFGFSVVIIQLFFFLIPAIIFKLASLPTDPSHNNADNRLSTDSGQKTLSIAVLLLGIYLLFRIFILWISDYYFAAGYNESKSQDYANAYKNIMKAKLINKNEPFFLDELSVPAVQLGLYLAQEGNSTQSARLINEGLEANSKALEISPNNVNFLKTRTRILYALTALDDKYVNMAIESLEKAKTLSPTDPKIRYNLALMYDSSGLKDKAYSELSETIRLKINYRDAYLAQAVFFARDGEKDKAKDALNFILKRINPDDEEAKKQLEEL